MKYKPTDKGHDGKPLYCLKCKGTVVNLTANMLTMKDGIGIQLIFKCNDCGALMQDVLNADTDEHLGVSEISGDDPLYKQYGNKSEE